MMKKFVLSGRTSGGPQMRAQDGKHSRESCKISNGIFGDVSGDKKSVSRVKIMPAFFTTVPATDTSCHRDCLESDLRKVAESAAFQTQNYGFGKTPKE